MKLLINTSNLYFGGGLQVALSFINELKDMNLKNEYHIFTSLAINKQLNKNDFPSHFIFYLIERSPSSLKTRKKIVTKLNTLEEKIQPNIVFSVFGPSYWRPKTLHLVGFADGWLYNPKSIAYEKLTFFRRIKMKLLEKYKSYYLKRDSDYFVLETQDAKEKLAKVLNIELSKIFVVGNTYSNIFNEKKYLNNDNEFYIKLPVKEQGEFRFSYIAHNHPAKNLQIINKIIPFIKHLNVKFVLTINQQDYEELFDKSYREKYIINTGPVEAKSCPSIYEQSDALFAPTLLETFSAAYPEAMRMNKPILTSDYSFARDICKDAAMYFNSLDVENSVKAVKLFVKDMKLRKRLVEKGKIELKTFETAKSRANKYLDICEKIINNGEIVNV